MKAKDFKELRSKVKYYQVDTTTGLFGRFAWDWNGSITVLATSHQHACYRAKRKGYGRGLSIGDECTTRDWARFRVKLLGKTDNMKNTWFY